VTGRRRERSAPRPSTGAGSPAELRSPGRGHRRHAAGARRRAAPRRRGALRSAAPGEARDEPPSARSRPVRSEGRSPAEQARRSIPAPRMTAPRGAGRVALPRQAPRRSSWKASDGSKAAIQRLASRTSTDQRRSSRRRSAARISVTVGPEAASLVASSPSITHASNHRSLSRVRAGVAVRFARKPARASSGTNSLSFLCRRAASILTSVSSSSGSSMVVFTEPLYQDHFPMHSHPDTGSAARPWSGVACA